MFWSSMKIFKVSRTGEKIYFLLLKLHLNCDSPTHLAHQKKAENMSYNVVFSFSWN